MINEARITIRNAGFLLAQRGFHILGSLLFAVLVPRLMGSNDYGRYALITSLSFWFIMLSDLGFPQIMGRYTPLFILFLGLNQAARWGMGEIFRHGFIIVSVIIGFYLGGLQGACLGLLLTEL